jgi:hypothetical protein
MNDIEYFLGKQWLPLRQRQCGRDSAAEKASAAGEAVSHFSQNCCEHFAGKYATNFIKAERIHNITARCKAQAA